jgi:hypothetical protein
MSLAASRHLRFAPILLAVPLALVLDALWTRLPRFDVGEVERVAAACSGALAVVLLLLWAWHLPQSLKLIDPVAPNPANAIEVLRANGLTGNVWNDYDWGGLLRWAAPEVRIAADGSYTWTSSMATVETVIQFDHLRDPLSLLRATGADLALLERTSPAIERISPTFRPLFCDEDACLLAREGYPLPSVLKVPPRAMHRGDFF